MTKVFLYLRTSADDRDRKAGIEVQRAAFTAYAQRAGYDIAAEFVDDGVTGKLPMHSRPQGKLLIAALLGDGVKTVLCYDSKRIGRTQPAFWSFVGQCRDIGVTVLDKDGADLRDSLKGGFEGLMDGLQGDHRTAGSRQARESGNQARRRSLGLRGTSTARVRR